MDNAVGRKVALGSVLTWFAGAVLATVVGITLTATATLMPGSELLTVEDFVDAAAAVVLGGLGVVLVQRGIAAGLGRALVMFAVLTGSIWLSGGLANAIADGSSPPLAAQLLSLASTVLFLPLFVLLFAAPLLLFPTGRLPSPRWRWVVFAAVSGTVAAMVSLLFAPGPVDEDVPAWGDNPLGVHGLDGLTSALEAVGLVLLLASVPASLAAVVVRVVRSNGARRRQMWWFIAGITPLILGLVLDAGDATVAQVISALVIFGGLIGGMAWALLGAPGRKVAAQQTRPASEGATVQPGSRPHLSNTRYT